MPELLSFAKHQVPRDIAIQIRSYYRIQWPHVRARDVKLWNFDPDNPQRPINFVLMEGEALVSHAEANWRSIEIAGQTLTCAGVSGVFTYPAWRGSGLAKEVVHAATEAIRNSDADLAMLFCGTRLKNFYSECGWMAFETARIFFGDPVNPQQEQCMTMALLLTEKGRGVAHRLASEPVFVGPSSW
jgi:predicted N-acetyltransferase YhbS